MFNLTMKFYVSKKNGKYCVQNAVGSYLGQYHEHTEEDFKKWLKNVPKQDVIYLDKG